MTTDISAEERARRAQEAKLKAEIARRMADEAAREAEEAERAAAQASDAGDAPETPEKPAEGRTGAKSAKAKPAESATAKAKPGAKPDVEPDDAPGDASDEAPDDVPDTDAVADADASADSDAKGGDTPGESDEAGEVKVAKPTAEDAADSDIAESDAAENGADADADADPDADAKAEKAGGRKKRGRRVTVVAEDAPGTEDAPAKKARRKGGFLGSMTPTVWGLTAACVLLAAALGGFLYGKSQIPGGDKDTKQVQFAATRAAEDISSYDYRTIDSDLKRAAGHTTGNFRKQFDQQITQVRTSAQQQQAVVEGQAVKTAVESVDGDRAIALVYLDQTTAKQASASRTPNQYTLRMVMKKIKGQWMVSDLQML